MFPVRGDERLTLKTDHVTGNGLVETAEDTGASSQLIIDFLFHYVAH